MQLDHHAKPRLFHVSREDYETGSWINPGRYGSASLYPTAQAPDIKAGQVGAILWEATLETARLAIAPTAVSRLHCVFAAETIELAQDFRNRFRPGASIYAAVPWHDARLFRGDFGLVTNIDPAAPFLAYMPAAAIRYWSEAPGADVEVLVGGPMTVLEFVE
ncbi:hypothetical protein MRF4_29335 [Methylobacterium radiotolerans]|uniref:hypothetical protein n=1 Tax=Methylobacterium TaxID=407 RepID=UPI002F2E0D57